MLQAYSLCKFLTSLKCDVQFIDYSTRDKAQLRPFADFAKEYLPTTKRINTFEELEDVQADILICGSDQIWNCDVSLSEGRDRRWDYYFLNFGKPSAKRIAYAASCGGIPIRGELHSRVRSALSNFDHISVRENGTKDIISDLTDKTVETVLDPVFLSEDFPIKQPKTILPDRYIAMFSVGRSFPLYKALNVVKKHFKLPIVAYDANDAFGKCPIADIHLPLLRPDEWLYFLLNSDILCTNSFHAVSFSIKFEKQFLAVPLVKPSLFYAGLNRLPPIVAHRVGLYLVNNSLKIDENQISKRMCRIDEILSSAGLSDRIVKNRTDIINSFKRIDYEDVKNRLRKPIGKSKLYLKKSMLLS